MKKIKNAKRKKQIIEDIKLTLGLSAFLIVMFGGALAYYFIFGYAL